MDELTQEDFQIFKEHLRIFLKSNFNACPDFLNGIIKSETEGELITHLRQQKDEVYENLGGDVPDKHEIWDMERKIDRLKANVDDLECELESVRVYVGPTLEDEYKVKAFEEHRNEFTSWELEELLKNGRKYLNENTNNLGYSQPTLFDTK
jgi:hypothetical protein